MGSIVSWIGPEQFKNEESQLSRSKQNPLCFFFPLLLTVVAMGLVA